MLHLMKVYRQPEIQDGGRKKVKALTLMAIFEVTLYTSQFQLQITQEHKFNDYFHVWDVS